MKRYVLALSLLAVPAAQAGEIDLLTPAAVESDTAEGGAGSPAVSADGRWVAFASTGGNLVAGQTETGTYPYEDVFLHDRQTGTTVLVSHVAGSATEAVNYVSNRPSISADGRWVAYLSRSGGITPGQNPDPFEQVFLYDRDTGTNTLVTHSTAGPLAEHNGIAGSATISADGNWIVFTTTGTDLIGGLNGPSTRNIFLYQRATGEIRLVSRAAGTTLTMGSMESNDPSISADGRYVAFESQATDLVAGYSQNFSPDVYLFDRVTGTMVLVSHTASSATQGAMGKDPVISADGSAVAFLSVGSNLVAGQADSNGWYDVFLFSRAAGTNVLASRSAVSPVTAGNGAAEEDFRVRISDTGAYVAFVSDASNAVAGQVNNPFPRNQVFLFERATSSLTLVSHSSASPATTGNHVSGAPAMSADGRYVAFHSQATDLVAGQVDPILYHDVFLFDRTTGTTTLVSGVNGSGQVAANQFSWFPQISADGAVVAYITSARNVVAGASDFNSAPDLVLHDRAAGTSGLATRHAPGMASATAGNFSMLSSASADGRYAVVVSWAENLAPGQVDGDTEEADVFLVDRIAGTTTLVSRSAASSTTTANGETVSAAISADGNWIVLNSIATDLVPGQVDTPQSPDVFLYERATGTVTLVSHAAGSAVTAGNRACGFWDWIDGFFPGRMAISADGRYVAFECGASNLLAGQTDGNFFEDVFLYDRVTGQTSLVSRTHASATAAGNATSYQPRISADGRWIAFTSTATDLVAGSTDANGTRDVFLHDRDTGQTLLVSRAAGTAATTAGAASEQPVLSPDGRYVVFVSEAANLVPGQTEGSRPTSRNEDVFLFDRATGTVELISRAAGSATATANEGSDSPAVSANGLLVAFTSRATNLLPGQTGPAGGVFVHDRTTRKTELISHSGASRTASLGAYGNPVLSPDGRYVAFVYNSLYVADRQLGTLERVASAATYFFTGDSSSALSLPVFGTGGTVFFNSADPFLSGNDFNNNFDVLAYTRTVPGASDFYTVAPCRLLNTLQTGPAPISGQTSILDVHGACGVPETATAVALNVTVLQSTGSGRVSVLPGNLLAPGVSTINFAANQTLANNAILPLASNGEGTLGITPFVIGGGTVHVIVDVSGYFE